MDQKFIKVPLVLSVICVASAGLISGVHALAQAYINSKPVSHEAPAKMKAMYPNATFEYADSFCSYTRKDSGMTCKATIASCYYVKDGGLTIAYAYDVTGESISGAVNIYASYSAEVSASTAADSINPAKVSLYQSAYANKKGPEALISALEGGADLDDTLVANTGSTESEKTVKSELIAARNDYIERKQGKTPGDCGTAPEVLPTDAKGWLEKKYSGATATKDESFVPTSETTSARYSIAVSERFKIVKDGAEIAWGYHTTGNIPDGSEETMDLAIAFEGTCASDDDSKKAFKPSYIAVISSAQQTITLDGLRDYADLINAGTVDPTVNPSTGDEHVSTGTTHSCKLVYYETTRARNDYLADGNGHIA